MAMDKALKQRLVGASVLIALAVIVLPMLLSGQADNQQETRSIEVPPKPSELSFETRRFPVGEQSNQVPSVVTQITRQDPVPRATGSRNEPVDTAPVDSTGEAETQRGPVESSAIDTPAQVVSDTTPRPGRYLVQVASFSITANANRLAASLRLDGLDVMMDTIEAAVGTLHRVRVGPYDGIDEAGEAVSLIQTRTPHVSPRVIDLRPDESAPVTDPSDPLVRWVIQVGSFEDQSNAKSLVSQLRAAGFSAYSIVVIEPGRTRFKVRVGPEIERQSAVQIAADIRAKLRLDGIVISVD